MLKEPFEIFELEDQGSETFHVVSWERGEMIIRPRDGSAPKVVNALRVVVQPGDKEHFPFYWDITSVRLIAMLTPQLSEGGFQQRIFTVTKHGVAPSAHFTLEVT